MDQLEFFHRVIHILHESRLAYMVVGSFASGFWGEPRATYDVDVVLTISQDDVPLLGRLFPADEFYYSEQAAREAIRLHRQFNVIHPDSGNKIDLVIQGTDPWSIEQISRRMLLEVAPGFFVYVAAPENVILGKMLYYREGGSEKHLRDIAGILKVRGHIIDLVYLDKWSQTLELSEEWMLVKQRFAEHQ